MISARTLVVAASLTLAPAAALAEASFQVQPAGSGFQDTTAVEPVGGNPGKTLGEQRLLVIKRALDLWGAHLDSKVPIMARVEFKPLGCDEHSAVVGQAVAPVWVSPSDAPSPDSLFYPIALADRLLGRDLRPGQPDILVEFNSSLDAEPCRTQLGGGMYYGFDAATRGGKDVLTTALHEIGHGLGFASLVDPETGAVDLPYGSDAFSAHIRDLDLDLPWSQLSAAQRARSALNVRRVVFDGPETRRAAQRFLALGTPGITVTPQVPGFSGWVADVAGALNSVRAPAQGPVVIGDPVSGCDDLAPSAKGAVVLLEPAGRCALRDALLSAERAGAVGILLVGPPIVDQPPLPSSAASLDEVTLPVLTLAPGDAVALARASKAQRVVAQLGGPAGQRQGADPQGRPLLYATQPTAPGSSISHFEPLARPDPLMEPYTNERPQHDLDLTVAVLRDVGWAPFCGNGVIDPGEVCDLGANNADDVNAACRTSCRNPMCGDGVRDPAEACDDGDYNSPSRPDACRPDCQLARCGDGVIDEGEECDGPDSCSSQCTLRIDPWEGREDGDGCRVGTTRSGASGSGTLVLVLVALGLRRRRRRRTCDRKAWAR